jgi:hypothetical protein
MITYDLECFPNFFSCAAMETGKPETLRNFEVSDRYNDMPILYPWLQYLSENKIEMTGFNNNGYDYLLIHLILQSCGLCSYQDLYAKNQEIIGSNNRFGMTIWPNQRLIPQLDLYQVHHFDNKARSTGLKALQINMRADNVMDSPIPFGTVLTDAEKDVTLSYGAHDTLETDLFRGLSHEQIADRRELSERYGRDFMNHNDTKVGKDYFIMRLEELDAGACYEKVNGRRQPRQTIRDSINIADAVFPYIKFERPEFQRILTTFKQQTITKAITDDEIKLKGFYENFSCIVDGFQFDFGAGGIHGSMTGAVMREDENHTIQDWDVASYYPNLAIANKVYPAHLGSVFCDIYLDVYNQRKQHKKGTSQNKMLKLALNGVYGDSNNKYSPFYDPLYTLTITINGQLLLCMLAEALMSVPGLTMIQINTDGLTIKVPNAFDNMVKEICRQWEAFTCLELEDVRYKMMAIRDVNNYIAVTDDDKVKRKGAFETALPGDRAPLGWHQDCSSLVIAQAAEAAIVRGMDVREYILRHQDPFDFMIRAKATKGAHLIMENIGHNSGEITERRMQKVNRFFVSKQGGSIFKIGTPPEGEVDGWFKRGIGVKKPDYAAWHQAWGNTHNPEIHTKNMSVYGSTRTSFKKGWLTTECNRIEDFDWGNLNHDYYIDEAMKLVKGVGL